LAGDRFVSVRPGSYFSICNIRNEYNFRGIVFIVFGTDVVCASEEYSFVDGDGCAIVEPYELLFGIVPIGSENTNSTMKFMKFHVKLY